MAWRIGSDTPETTTKTKCDCKDNSQCSEGEHSVRFKCHNCREQSRISIPGSMTIDQFIESDRNKCPNCETPFKRTDRMNVVALPKTKKEKNK